MQLEFVIYGGIFFQGNIFLAGVAAADDVVWSSAVYAGAFCNEEVGRGGSKSVSWTRSIKRRNWRHAVSSRPSNSEPAYLDDILITNTIVVIVEGEINCRPRTGDDLPNGGEVIVVGIGHFCLLRGIGCAAE
jgi:hypothetical protein